MILLLAHKSLTRGRKTASRAREPFAIQLLGQKLFVCTAPKDVAAVFDNKTDFNFDNHLTNLLKSFRISPEALKSAWHEPKPGDWCYIPNNPVNPKQKSLIHCVEDIYSQQLLPGDRMDKWSQTFLSSLSSSLLTMNDLKPFVVKYTECVWCSDCSPQVSLYSFVSFFNVQATAFAMFGSHLHDIDPLAVNYMISFNEHVWMAVFRCPNIIGLPLDEPRRKLMNIMRVFVRLRPDQRRDASWAITNVLEGMEQIGMDMESRASMLVMIFWASVVPSVLLHIISRLALTSNSSVSNEHNACYWLLLHLLYNESLLKVVRNETEAAWELGELDVKHLCANSPNLESVYNEVLRLNNTAAAVRIASKTAMIGGKILPSGSTILLPLRQLHINEDVWGSNVNDFDPTRFLHNKSLTRSPSFRPFGGGATLCPGQTLARQEIFGFIAILLHRFDVRLIQTATASKPPFPRLNSMAPSFGLNGPVQGTDVLVSVAQIDFKVPGQKEK